MSIIIPYVFLNLVDINDIDLKYGKIQYQRQDYFMRF